VVIVGRALRIDAPPEWPVMMEADSMSYRRAARMATCLAVLGGVLAGPVSGASASAASIKNVIGSYNASVLVAEGHVVSAIGEYKKTGDPKGAQAAITSSIDVLRSLKSKLATQAAVRRRVKAAKAKLEHGLEAIIVGYTRLSTAYGEQNANPGAASALIAKAARTLLSGRKELGEGLKLLR
jgi:hypothetical protein